MQYGMVIVAILLLLGGCNQPKVEDANNNTATTATATNNISKPKVVKQTYVPPPPAKKIKLKEVDDTNFNTAYMYPEDTKKEPKKESPAQAPVVAEDTMDKEECIAMITQEKFEKYAAIFGSEAASIKRCKMLKATR